MNRKNYFLKLVALIICVAGIMGFVTIDVYALDISAKSAVLMEADSHTILYSKNPDARMSMASTTKVMTSIIALENADLNTEITVNKEMVCVEGTSMGLLPGDKVSIYELVCGMLLASGNDAANSVAISVSGSIPKFAELMNAYAKKIGMNNTSLVTPSGLDADEHYSTARDMALLGAYVIKNREFSNICSAKSMRVDYGNPPFWRTLTNHNRLLSSYDGCIGIKTGYTKKSGRCLVSAARRNGVTLIAVTLSAPDDWNDHKKMFDYGFSVSSSKSIESDLNLKLPVAGGKTKLVEVEFAFEPKLTTTETYNPRIVRKVYLNRFEYAPLPKGKVVGETVYINNDNNEVILKVPVVTANAVDVKR